MRALCPRCRLPLPSCLCRWITPTANPRPVLVLQHPQEAGHAKNSVRLLALSLANCRVLPAQPPLPADALAAELGPPGHSLLVFPATPGAMGAGPGGGAGDSAGDGAGGVPSAARADTARACQLVLLDGTWRQARQLLAATPALAALPRLALADPPPARYAVRRAHHAAQRSTLEATCLALAELDGAAARMAPLLEAFSAWVQTLTARQPPQTPRPGPVPPRATGRPG